MSCPRILFVSLCLICYCVSLGYAAAADNTTTVPNIVLIYGDDIGYGDLGCYGAETISTPNIDALAEEGVRFTSAYCSSATCTPSRYSLLTGEYAWRKKGTGIAPPNGSLLIAPGRATLPSILRDEGYTTGIVGKWHLGLGDPPKPNWSGEIKPGPLEIGFDYCFLMPTTNDRVPCVYVENHRIVGLDPADPVDVFSKNPDGQLTGKTERASLKMDWTHGHNDTIVNGISRIGFMVGGHKARWIDENMSDVFLHEAEKFIAKSAENPFFLFFSSQAIHVPRTPNARFVGSTPHGPRGDCVVEFDACVGTLTEALKKAGVYENTLIIITSDNGPVLDDGYRDGAVAKIKAHRPAGPYRGGKYSIFEGGTRVPMVVHCPSRVKQSVSDALISQVDLAASLHTLAGANHSLAEQAIPDSLDLSDSLLGNSSSGREHLVEHAGTLAVRRGQWKYIKPSKGPKKNWNTNTELGNNKMPQLYDLKADPSEQKNLAESKPELTNELQHLLETIEQSGERTMR